MPSKEQIMVVGSTCGLCVGTSTACRRLYSSLPSCCILDNHLDLRTRTLKACLTFGHYIYFNLNLIYNGIIHPFSVMSEICTLAPLIVHLLIKLSVQHLFLESKNSSVIIFQNFWLEFSDCHIKITHLQSF